MSKNLLFITFETESSTQFKAKSIKNTFQFVANKQYIFVILFFHMPNVHPIISEIQQINIIACLLYLF